MAEIMNILRDATESILPWQQNFLDKLASGGYKRDEMIVHGVGRRAGKSYYALSASMQINKLKFMKIAESDVDNEPWYSVLVGTEAAIWLRSLNNEFVAEVGGTQITGTTVFDVHEKIYALLVLKFK